MTDETVKVLIVLVHGTWNPTSLWLQPRSHFRNRIAAALRSEGVKEVRFSRLIWSGANNHQARAAAGDALAERLKFLRSRFPTHRLIVVGHSHGGNVALRGALLRDAGGQTVDGVVTLATPFLAFEKVNPATALLIAGLRNAAWIGLTLLPIAALGLGFFWLIHATMPWLLDLKLGMLRFGRNWPIQLCELTPLSAHCTAILHGTLASFEALSSFLLLVGMLIVAFAQAPRTIARPRAASRKTAMALACFDTRRQAPAVPLFVLTAPLDELVQVLLGAQWLHRTGLWLARSFVLIVLASGLAAAGIGLFALLWRQEQLLTNAGSSSWDVVLLALLCFSVAPLLFAFGAGLALALGFLAGRALPLVDTRSGSANLHWAARARHLPFANTLVKSRRFRLAELRGGGSMLRHSLLYGSDPAIDGVAAFILSLPPQVRPV
ncbi:MAG: GPI inositol-deacylase [Sphingomonas sp.]|uniref:esterase/lipase family protein n=1 Tax=Sphingomonas sp. TaxID=28214 RepID=UPI0025E8C86A|nr:hypothetical protein [Sphingomonas sp.]MBY0284897.1 GPI inositol-deacylase [Sphingomonas sp.]